MTRHRHTERQEHHVKTEPELRATTERRLEGCGYEPRNRRIPGDTELRARHSTDSLRACRQNQPCGLRPPTLKTYCFETPILCPCIPAATDQEGSCSHCGRHQQPLLLVSHPHPHTVCGAGCTVAFRLPSHTTPGHTPLWVLGSACGFLLCSLF